MPENIVFTDLEKETLALMKYHLKRIQGEIDAGRKDVDDDKRMAMLREIPDKVMDRAVTRRDYEKSVAKDKAALLKQRLEADCPTCKKPQKVKIEGSAKNETFGWSLDVVKCTVCKTKFANPTPNNWGERLAFMENLTDVLFSGTERANAVLERMDSDEKVDKEKWLADVAAMRESHLAAEAAFAAVEAAWMAADEAFEAIYDMLLIAKVNHENLNSGGRYFA